MNVTPTMGSEKKPQIGRRIQMSETNTLARSMHDLGAAVWTGGSLMGAIGLNGASEATRDARESTRVANAGWSKWTPVNLAAIGAHVIGGIGLLRGNKGRLVSQKGAMTTNVTKTVLTAAALGATAYSRILGEKIMRNGDVPAHSGVDPDSGTPDDVAKAQKQLATLQWVIPALTGSIVILGAVMGEQQRPTWTASGIARRLLPN